MDIKISKQIKKNLKGKIYVGDIEEKKIKKKYDVIFLLHTLEHILNPLKAVKNIEHLLKKNGRVFIEIPNFDYFIRKRPHYAVFHQHLNMYNIKNFKNLLSFTELSIEKRKVSLSIKLLEENLRKTALEKYGSEIGSGKQLPFSSLSEDLKKKDKEKK